MRRRGGLATRQDQRTRALEFLRKEAEEAGSLRPKKYPRLYRIAAYKFLCTLDNQFRVATGFGWKAFLPIPPPAPRFMGKAAAAKAEAEAEQPWHDEGKLMALCIDQEAVGWCACMFLLYACKARLLLTFDPSHRAWNDLKAAYAGAGCWDAVLLWGVVFSINHGPYDTAAWWRTAQEAAQEYSDSSSSSCPLLQAHLPGIAEERGERRLLHTQGYAENVLQDFWQERCFQCKGPMLALARWMQWLHCWRYWDSQRFQRLLGLLYLGIDLGYLNSSASSSALNLDAVKDLPAAKSQKGTKASASRDLAALRRICSNQLHIATLVLADPDLHRKGKIMAFLGQGVERWHSDQVKQMTSAAGNLAFFQSQAAGAWWPSVVAAFKVAADTEQLQELGFHTAGSPEELSSLTREHPLVLEEACWSGLVMRICLQIFFHRTSSLLWHYGALPGKLALLTSGSVDLRKTALQTAQSYCRVWEAAKAQGAPAVKDMVKRSFMQWTIVQEACAALEQTGFTEVPAELVEDLTAAFSCAPTALIENGFNAMRSVEVLENKNKAVSSARKWWAPISHELLSGRQHYHEVPWKQEALTPQEPQSLPDSCFSGRLSAERTTCNLKAIVSTQQQGGWATTNPATFSALAGDMVVMAECQVRNAWGMAEHSWLCSVPEPGQLVRRIGQASWWFIAGNMESSSLSALTLKHGCDAWNEPECLWNIIFYCDSSHYEALLLIQR